MNKWDMIAKPKKENEKWLVSIINAWTKDVVEEYEFNKENQAKDFYEKKAKELAFRGMK